MVRVPLPDCCCAVPAAGASLSACCAESMVERNWLSSAAICCGDSPLRVAFVVLAAALDASRDTSACASRWRTGSRCAGSTGLGGTRTGTGFGTGATFGTGIERRAGACASDLGGAAAACGGGGSACLRFGGTTAAGGRRFSIRMMDASAVTSGVGVGRGSTRAIVAAMRWPSAAHRPPAARWTRSNASKASAR